MKKKENQLQTDSAPKKKDKKKSGCLVVVSAAVIIGVIATAGGNSSSDSKTASSVASLEGAETEIMQESTTEPVSVPEPNTSDMVDYIAKEAKASANVGSTEEKREEAISFIQDNYPNYFIDNETMEKTMYYGYYLEYAYSKNGPENIYANLGIDTYQAVKGVYRNVDKVEDDIVQENLRQIEEWLSKL